MFPFHVYDIQSLTRAVHARHSHHSDFEKRLAGLDRHGYHHPNGTHPPPQTRDLVLESRNLQNFCQATVDCVKEDGLVQVVGCMGAVFEAADSLVTGAQTFWDVLNKPIIATFVGATCASVAANKINGAGAPAPVPGECSTSQSPKDAALASVSAATSRTPSASSVACDCVGPTTFYTITVTATPEGQAPATPVAGQCFSAKRAVSFMS